MTRLGPDFDRAFQYAHDLHRDQQRKETTIPYLSHLMSAASLVLEAGGDEEQAIAALLHDAAEDQGGQSTLDEIRVRFGDRVANIVDACTDTVEEPKPEWRERKEQYLAHLQTADQDALLVSCADKLHNARSILSDYRTHGDALWQRFTAPVDGQLWYYRSLTDVFQERLDNPLAEELRRTVNELVAAVEN